MSTIPISLYRAISDRERPKLRSSALKITAGNHTPINFYGRADFDLEMENMTLDVTFYICDDNVSGILGMDFIDRHGGIIMTPHKKLIIQGRSVAIHRGDGLKVSHLVVAEKKIRVAANTRMLVVAKVAAREGITTKGLLMEPAQNLASRTGVAAARVTVTPHENYIPVELTNAEECTKTIPAGTVLGELEDAIGWTAWNATHRPLTASVQKIVAKLDATPTVPAHVQQLYDQSKEGMTETEDIFFRQLLSSYQDIFAKSRLDLGRTNLVEHHIDTGDAAPVRHRPRRLPQVQLEEMEKQVRELADAKIIEPSTSNWGSNVILVKKKDGTMRMCVDYRELNAKTMCLDPYAMPRIDDMIESLGRSKVYCSLDLIQGYHQVKLTEEAKQKTAFLAPRMVPSQWQYNYMPFGVQGGPATFQRLMDRLLCGLEYRIALAYLDDIIVFGKDIMQCIERLEMVFARLRDANLKLKPSKCELFKLELLFLGYIVSGEGIKCDPKKIDVIRNWCRPCTRRQVRCFLGTVNYYHRFIEGYSETARPLYQLTSKRNKFEWTQECQIAYEMLRFKLICAPIMAYPRSEGQYILDTDASGHAIGAVLSQMQSDDDAPPEERVIAYGSRMLNTAEQHYCTRRREMLAIVTFVKVFRSYLYGRKVLIRTDHASLKYLKTMKDPADQFARWIERLEECEYEIEIRQGKNHSNADGLSRLGCEGKKCICEGVANLEQQIHGKPKKRPKTADKPTSTTEEPPLVVMQRKLAYADKKPPEVLSDEEALVSAIRFDKLWTRDEMSIAQMEDPDISHVYMAKLENNYRPKWNAIGGESEALKALYLEWKRLEMHDGNLYRRWESDDGTRTRLQVVMPHKYRELILEQFHDSSSAAHMGKRRALNQIQRRAFWYRMAEDVKLYIQSCDVCQRRKRPGKTPRAPMPIFNAGVPNERVSLDIAGPLIITARFNKYVLVVTDQYTKYVRAFPLRNKSTELVAKVFHTGWICLFGCPRQIHTDQGKEFESALFKEMCRMFQSEKTRTTTYHPSSDGQVERYNRTMWNLIHALVRDDPIIWDECLPYTSQAYNATKHSSTGIEPNMLMFNRLAHMPYDIMTPETPDAVALPQNQYVLMIRRRMRRVHQLAREQLGHAASMSRKYNDRLTNLNRYSPGDPVLMKVMIKTPRTGKMEDRYKGPYYVVDVLSDSSLRIVRAPMEKPFVVHHDRIKPYVPRKASETDTSWVLDLSKTAKKHQGTEMEVRPEPDGAVAEDTPADDAPEEAATVAVEPRPTEDDGVEAKFPIPVGPRKTVKVTEPPARTTKVIKRRRGAPVGRRIKGPTLVANTPRSC